MRIKEGQKAKDFTVTDIYDNEISLKNFKGKRLLLSFFRYASCPLCNLRVNQLATNFPSPASKGLEILAFFESPKENILKYVGKQNPPFPIIADPERIVYKLYGVEKSLFGYMLGGISLKMLKALRMGYKIEGAEGEKTLLPADFLIDDLIVKRAYYSRRISDHLPIEELTELISNNSKKNN